MRGPCAPLLLRATLPESTGWNPSEIPSQTRSVSAFLSGQLSLGPRKGGTWSQPPTGGVERGRRRWDSYNG
jgi:hypothetical protein